MADDEDIAALVVDNGSGMCKGVLLLWTIGFCRVWLHVCCYFVSAFRFNFGSFRASGIWQFQCVAFTLRYFSV